VVICVAADQGTKRWATATLRSAPTQSFAMDSIRLHYAMNSGGFLSFGSELPERARRSLFIGFNLLLMLGLGWFLIANPHRNRGPFIGVGLLFAGGIGNLIDRLLHNGQVIDFLNLGIGWLRTGIFNVADVAIVAGAGLVVLCSWNSPAAIPQAETAATEPPAADSFESTRRRSA